MIGCSLLFSSVGFYYMLRGVIGPLQKCLVQIMFLHGQILYQVKFAQNNPQPALIMRVDIPLICMLLLFHATVQRVNLSKYLIFVPQIRILDSIISLSFFLAKHMFFSLLYMLECPYQFFGKIGGNWLLLKFVSSRGHLAHLDAHYVFLIKSSR